MNINCCVRARGKEDGMGPKEREWLERMREGISFDEAEILLREVKREKARARQPQTNPFCHDDPRLQRFSDLWFSQQRTASVDQKDRVGIAYISNILVLGDEVARRFAEGDHDVYDRVGRRQGGLERFKPDLYGFWRKMGEIFPGIYTEEEVVFLVQEGMGIASLFKWQLEIPLAEDSSLLERLVHNAHAYK